MESYQFVQIVDPTKHPCKNGPQGGPCNRIRPGHPYDITSECRTCWNFNHRVDFNLAWGGDGKVFAVVGEPVPPSPPPPPKPLLGDRVKGMFERIGATQERVRRVVDWLGFECGCVERQQRMNELDRIARETTGQPIGVAEGALKTLLAEFWG